VPASFANRPVSLRIYPDRIVIAAEGRILCEHGRIIARSHHLPGRIVYDWRHYLAVIQRKPGAPRNGARFPAYKDLAGFDFASSEVDKALVKQLHRGEFIDGAHNVVAVGGSGTGKTHIATALGVQAVEHHRKKERFFSTVDLVNALEQEKAMNKAGQLAERLLRLDLVILDELGYLPFSPSGGARCSTCSANSTSAPASPSPPTSASANRPTCSVMPK
jgi:DNA replication protein DnaC